MVGQIRFRAVSFESVTTVLSSDAIGVLLLDQYT